MTDRLDAERPVDAQATGEARGKTSGPPVAPIDAPSTPRASESAVSAPSAPAKSEKSEKKQTPKDLEPGESMTTEDGVRVTRVGDSSLASVEIGDGRSPRSLSYALKAALPDLGDERIKRLRRALTDRNINSYGDATAFRGADAVHAALREALGVDAARVTDALRSMES